MAATNGSVLSFYTPLDPLKSEIRLLEISAEAISMVVCSLLDGPNYRALSYVWGDPSITEIILVNGNSFRATANLASALHSVRHEASDGSIRLWADAICINQNDLDEKGQQVQLMGDIYRQASVVLSWLGCDPQICLALDAIDLISDLMGPASEFRNQNELEWMRAYPRLYREDDTTEPGFNKSWSAVRSLFTNNYWHRVWIVQEVVLATRILVRAANKDIELRKLFKIAGLLKFKFESRPDFITPSTWAFLRTCAASSNTLMTLFVTQSIWQDFHVPDKTSFKTSLLFDMNHQATNPRDQVYALNELMGKAFIPDYRKPTNEVYTEWAEAYIKTHRDLRLLWHCCGSNPDLPSWVPDWSNQSSNNTRFGMEYRDIFHADKGMGCAKPEIRSKGKLSAHGYTYDVVETIAKQNGIATDQDKEGMIRLCYKFRSQNRNIMDGQGIAPLQLLLRTLLWDIDPLVPRWVRMNIQSPTNFRWVLAFLKLMISSEEMELDQQVRKLGLQRGDRFAASISETFFPNLSPLSMDTFNTMWDTNIEALFHFGNKAMLNLGRFRFFLTSQRRLGMCLPEVRSNDIVTVLKGSEYPIILRPGSEGYTNMGKCFVFGIMDGEISGYSEANCLKSEEFLIV